MTLATATNVTCRLTSDALITAIQWDDGSFVVTAMSTQSIREVELWHGGMQLSECPKYDVATLIDSDLHWQDELIERTT